jgi:hypothetical protein
LRAVLLTNTESDTYSYSDRQCGSYINAQCNSNRNAKSHTNSEIQANAALSP